MLTRDVTGQTFPSTPPDVTGQAGLPPPSGVTGQMTPRKQGGVTGRYWDRVRQDLCTRCGLRPMTEGRRTCTSCAQQHRTAMHQVRAQRRQAGTCLQCGKKPFPGEAQCSKCQRKGRFWRRVSRSRARDAAQQASAGGTQ
jgi:hypothetical protein